MEETMPDAFARLFPDFSRLPFAEDLLTWAFRMTILKEVVGYRPFFHDLGFEDLGEEDMPLAPALRAPLGAQCGALSALPDGLRPALRTAVSSLPWPAKFKRHYDVIDKLRTALQAALKGDTSGNPRFARGEWERLLRAWTYLTCLATAAGVDDGGADRGIAKVIDEHARRVGMRERNSSHAFATLEDHLWTRLRDRLLFRLYGPSVLRDLAAGLYADLVIVRATMPKAESAAAGCCLGMAGAPDGIAPLQELVECGSLAVPGTCHVAGAMDAASSLEALLPSLGLGDSIPVMCRHRYEYRLRSLVHMLRHAQGEHARGAMPLGDRASTYILHRWLRVRTGAADYTFGMPEDAARQALGMPEEAAHQALGKFFESTSLDPERHASDAIPVAASYTFLGRGLGWVALTARRYRTPMASGVDQPSSLEAPMRGDADDQGDLTVGQTVPETAMTPLERVELSEELNGIVTSYGEAAPLFSLLRHSKISEPTPVDLYRLLRIATALVTIPRDVWAETLRVIADELGGKGRTKAAQAARNHLDRHPGVAWHLRRTDTSAAFAPLLDAIAPPDLPASPAMLDAAKVKYLEPRFDEIGGQHRELYHILFPPRHDEDLWRSLFQACADILRGDDRLAAAAHAYLRRQPGTRRMVDEMATYAHVMDPLKDIARLHDTTYPSRADENKAMARLTGAQGLQGDKKRMLRLLEILPPGRSADR